MYIYVSFTGLFRLTLRTSHTSTRHACRPHTLIKFLKKEVVQSVYVGLFYRVLCMYTRLFCRSLYVHFGLFINEEDVRFRIKRLLSVSLRTFWPLNWSLYADTDIRGGGRGAYDTGKSKETCKRDLCIHKEILRERRRWFAGKVCAVRKVSRKRPVKETYEYTKRP